MIGLPIKSIVKMYKSLRELVIIETSLKRFVMYEYLIVGEAHVCRVISFCFFLQEQQLYYKEITEACVGSDETRRTVRCHNVLGQPSAFKLVSTCTCTYMHTSVRSLLDVHVHCFLIGTCTCYLCVDCCCC